MKIWRKTLSLVLALVVCLGFVLPAAASDTGTVGQTAVIAAGAYHSAVIDSNHTLWTWGANDYGQLGNGGEHDSTYVVRNPVTNIDGPPTELPPTIHNIQTTPVKVLENVVSVSCGSFFTAAIKEDGTLWMWGQNHCGELGTGTTQSESTPVKVLDQVVAVSCGYSHTAAIRQDGSLWIWGHNLYGQLGTNGAANDTFNAGRVPIQTVPVKVMDHVVAVSCGSFHTAAIKTDGTLWVWGRNASDQLNLGDSIKVQLTPVQIRSQVQMVGCGDDSIVIVDSDGSFTAWGSYKQMQLPQRKDVIAISWGSEWRLASVFSDGSLWVRGYDYAHFDNKVYMLMNDVCMAVCGDYHILAVKTDGSVWVWGFNEYGQVGNGGLGEKVVNGGAGFSSNLLQKTPYKLPSITAAIPGSAPAPTVSAPKTDGGATVSAWALETVNNAEKSNLVPGSLVGSDMTQNITRADFAAVSVKLYEALTGQAASPAWSNPFTDTNDAEILKAYALDIVSGTSPTTFEPDALVTREQAAVMLTNVYTKLGYSIPAVSATSFADNSSISRWALDAVSFMSGKGIVNGVGNSMFDPKGTASVEQALTISYRVLTTLKH